MLEVIFVKEIITSFVGTLLALFSAGLIWFLKSSYEKYGAEKRALAKFERIFANNLAILKDNFEFVDKWISSLENNRPYSFQFEKYFIDEDETFKLSDLKLINEILSINHKLRRTSLDLENIYKNYWEVIFKIDLIQDQVTKEANLKHYHKTILNTLQQIRTNYKTLKKDLVSTIALVRAVDKVRFHSLFGYLSLLFINIFPRVTEMSIKKEIDKLEKNIEEISKKNHSEERRNGKIKITEKAL